RSAAVQGAPSGTHFALRRCDGGPMHARKSSTTLLLPTLAALLLGCATDPSPAPDERVGEARSALNPCDDILCPGGTPTCCDGECKNIQTDVENCGACGHACAPHQMCVRGRCACETGRGDC